MRAQLDSKCYTNNPNADSGTKFFSKCSLPQSCGHISTVHGLDLSVLFWVDTNFYHHHHHLMVSCCENKGARRVSQSVVQAVLHRHVIFYSSKVQLGRLVGRLGLSLANVPTPAPESLDYLRRDGRCQRDSDENE